MFKSLHLLDIKIVRLFIFFLGLALILLINGAIPFVSVPTLGQMFWTMGFAQSIANQGVFDLYATNFGYPSPAAMAFGLAGAYPASLALKLGLDAVDAYALMIMFWLSISFFSAYKIATYFKLSTNYSTLCALLWASMPVIWNHASYSMISTGIALLSFYFMMSMILFKCFDDDYVSSLKLACLYMMATIVAVFMDGYSFMMFAIGSSIIAAYMYIFFPNKRWFLLRYSSPVHITSFAVAYILYALYIGKTEFAAAALDFFRGWGVDVMFLAVPSKGVLWLWDTLGLSVTRSASNQFGDASVWITTFSLPVIVMGMTAWFFTRKQTKLAYCFLLVTFFGFYMALGPSVKLDSVKPEGITSPLMEAQYAVAPTGNALLSNYLPGFKNMRASYRWVALGLFGFWLLLVLLLSQTQNKRIKLLIGMSFIFLTLSNLPNIPKKIANNIYSRESFFIIENTLVSDLKKDVITDEVAAFLPYRNDFFVNYLASRIDVRTYNIGGDKNLNEARKHWPVSMSKFKMGEGGKDFSEKILSLLANNDADVVFLPYIDLLWAAHMWPAPLKYKDEIKPIIEKLRSFDAVEIDERNFYAAVRLDKKFMTPLGRSKILKNICLEHLCIDYAGGDVVPSQVGSLVDLGMKTDGRAGYLMYGPYESLEAGEYILQVTGSASPNSGTFIIDVVNHKAGKVYAHYKTQGRNEVVSKNVLLEERVILGEDVPRVEVRVQVNAESDIFVDGYSLRRVKKLHNMDKK